MAGGRADTHASDHRTSRRHFFKLLAGSPMLAVATPSIDTIVWPCDGFFSVTHATYLPLKVNVAVLPATLFELVDPPNAFARAAIGHAPA